MKPLKFTISLFFILSLLLVKAQKVTIFINNSIELPQFIKHNPNEYNKNARYLVVEYGKGNFLLKETANNDTIFFAKAKALKANSTLMVFAKGFNASSVDSMQVSINGSDYTYEYGIQDIRPQSTKAIDNSTDANTEEKRSNDTIVNIKDQNIIIPYENYLRKVLSHLNSQTLACANEQNMQLLNQLKRELSYNIDTLKQKKYTLNEAALQYYNDIQNWQFLYTPLTPIAQTIPENDKVEVLIDYTKNDKTTQFKPAIYRPAGLLGFSLNSNLFVTGLVNKEVYSDSLVIDSTYKELRAMTSAKKSKIAIGIGVNASLEISTGSVFTPSLNIGFFVPFDENISPRIALGPGLSIGNSRVKFNCNAGLALGEVDEIADRYNNKDLSVYEQGITLTEKVWKTSWQVGIGLSYNIAKISTGKTE